MKINIRLLTDWNNIVLYPSTIIIIKKKLNKLIRHNKNLNLISFHLFFPFVFNHSRAFDQYQFLNEY